MNTIRLIKNKLKGCLTAEEEIHFQNWLKESEDNQDIYNRLKETEDDLSEFQDVNAKKAWLQVKQKLEAEKKPYVLSYRQYLAYAAIFICLLGLGYQYLNTSLEPSKGKGIKPDAITLQLDNGEIKVLSASQTDAILDEKGNVLVRQKGNELDYTQSTIDDRLVYNTLTIPYGKRFNIALSDGSVVYLNAGSSLKYPVKFIKNKPRQVFLEGEAFFDVSQDKEHPFIVNSEDMNVRVLGTKFNVTSYPEDSKINTVLVEGSVSLYANEANDVEIDSTILQPGYKAAWQKSNKTIELKKVNTDIYTSWLNGKLMLKKMPFKAILKKLQRHYNVSIVNTYEQLNSKVFTATFDSESIDEVLEIFAEDTFFEYRKEGNHITIFKSDATNPINQQPM